MATALPIRERPPDSEFEVVFDGYGKGLFRSDVSGPPTYGLIPNEAVGAARTHSALIVSRADAIDFELNVDVRTLSQLRKGSEPNPWEVAWIVWRLQDADHFYYLALKTNGWEVGKRDPAYPGGQRFLATGSTPKYPVGTRWHRVNVVASGPTFVVRVDNNEITRFDDRERPYLVGRTGIYTEDAHVEFRFFAASPTTNVSVAPDAAANIAVGNGQTLGETLGETLGRTDNQTAVRTDGQASKHKRSTTTEPAAPSTTRHRWFDAAIGSAESKVLRGSGAPQAIPSNAAPTLVRNEQPLNPM